MTSDRVVAPTQVGNHCLNIAFSLASQELECVSCRLITEKKPYCTTIAISAWDGLRNLSKPIAVLWGHVVEYLQL